MDFLIYRLKVRPRSTQPREALRAELRVGGDTEATVEPRRVQILVNAFGSLSPFLFVQLGVKVAPPTVSGHCPPIPKNTVHTGLVTDCVCV